jgi:hypothetical protein
MHLQECGGEEKGSNTRTLTRLASSGQAGPGRGWRGEAMGIGARRAREWSAKIWPKASQVCGFLLSFIFAMSPCLIRFDRDKTTRLRDVVTLGGSSL